LEYFKRQWQYRTSLPETERRQAILTGAKISTRSIIDHLLLKKTSKGLIALAIGLFIATTILHSTEQSSS
jgi:hypothetical protein